MTTAALALFSNPIDTPFAVPVAGCLMILGIVVAGIWSGVRTREMQSQERLAAIAKGIPFPTSTPEVALAQVRPATTADTVVSLYTSAQRGNLRRGGLICLGIGVGLIAFFLVLAAVLQVRPVLAGAAAGLIPLGIGVALLVDARIQSREMKAAVAQMQSSRDRSI